MADNDPRKGFRAYCFHMLVHYIRRMYHDLEMPLSDFPNFVEYGGFPVAADVIRDSVPSGDVLEAIRTHGRRHGLAVGYSPFWGYVIHCLPVTPTSSDT
jgi:hypothetical protein